MSRCTGVIALLGNLARDVFPGEAPRTGGAPYHAARALRHLALPGAIYARCASADRAELMPALLALGGDVHYVHGETTASFAIEEKGPLRRMRVLAIGDAWRQVDLPGLPPAVEWVHAAPLLRSDFPPDTLAALARGRKLSLDGQGLVRAARLGALELDADYDPALLGCVQVLKLSDEEAAVLGDLASLPVPELLITHGPAGATVVVSGRSVDVSAGAVGGNHTGTGDAFSIAYLAARADGAQPVGAAQRAVEAVSAMLREGG